MSRIPNVLYIHLGVNVLFGNSYLPSVNLYMYEMIRPNIYQFISPFVYFFSLFVPSVNIDVTIDLSWVCLNGAQIECENHRGGGGGFTNCPISDAFGSTCIIILDPFLHRSSSR